MCLPWNHKWETLAWVLVALLLFSNWLWFVFFTSYRNTIKKHLDKR